MILNFLTLFTYKVDEYYMQNIEGKRIKTFNLNQYNRGYLSIRDSYQQGNYT